MQNPNEAAPTNNGNVVKNLFMGLTGLFIGGLIFVVGLSMGVAASSGFSFAGASPFPPRGTATTSIETPVVGSQTGLNTSLMSDVLRRLRTQWYGEIPADDKLTDGAIRGMVSALGDEFTTYVEPKFAKMLEDDTSGSFEGIGATLRQLPNSGGVQIVRTFDGSPAFKAGVLAGDVIESVNGTKVSGLSTTEVAALVRGPKGTTVTLSLRRADRPKPFDLAIVRDRIVIPLVTSKTVGNGAVAYVSLFDFSAQANGQLRSRIEELLKQNPKGLILDLRDNPGGLLSQSIEVGDQFLKEGVFLIERDFKGNKKESRTTSRGIAQDVPLVVLVNGGSASASEILAGAIQDYGRGVLIGETTFGKGSVQSPQNLPNGGQLRITIERWFTPKDRAIHGVGITPDYVVVNTPEDQKAARDPQLDAAVDYLLFGKTPLPVAIPTVQPRP